VGSRENGKEFRDNRNQQLFVELVYKKEEKKLDEDKKLCFLNWKKA
jgi:hypothetical protein